MKRRKTTKLVAALLCLTTLLALVPAAALAREDDGPPGMAPRGYVEINGELAAGVPVVAKVEDPVLGWVEYGPCTTDATGFFDFQVCGIGIEEPRFGLTYKVHFFVWDIEARNDFVGPTGMTWQPGTVNVGPEDDPLVITKADLVATFVAPEDGATYPCGSTFDIVATVTNTGMETATDVAADLTISDYVDVGTPSADPADGELEPGETMTITWPAECTDPGTTDIDVMPSGRTPDQQWQSTDTVPIPDANLEGDSISITQELRAHLVASVTAPATVTVGQVFDVSGDVENTCVNLAEDVTVTIDIEGPAELVPGEDASVSLPDIGPTQSVTWQLACTGSGPVTVTVTPAGTDQPTGDPAKATADEAVVLQQSAPDLQAAITAPADGEVYSSGQAFTVSANVENMGEATAESATATIAIDGPAQLAAGEDLAKDLTDLGPDQTVSWDLACTGSGPVTITVTPAGTDANTGLAAAAAADEVVVQQETKAALVAEIMAPADGATLSTEQVFVVSAEVTNPGEAVAENVSATISVSGPAQLAAGESAVKSLADIGAAQTVTWTLECTGTGAVDITVTPSGTDENSGMAVVATPDTVTVDQEAKAHLVADILAPTDGETYSSEDVFTVSASVQNTGDAVAEDATATIGLTGPAELAPGESVSKSVGDLSGTQATAWLVRCTGSGAVTITVTPAGTDENTGAAIPAEDIEADSVVVEQETRASLVADITAPSEGETYSSEETFEVSADVENTGEAVAETATAMIVIDGPAQLVAGETSTKALGDLSGATTVAWTLECTGSGAVTITVTPAGTDENTGEAIPPADIVADSVTVLQEEKAELVATVTAPSSVAVGSEYVVSAVVENPGDAVAEDVSAAVDIDGPAELVAGETATKALPNIGATQTVTWMVRCTDSGPVTITVTPAGTDENSGLAVDATADTATVDQQFRAELVAEITAPADGDTFSAEQEFVVSASISNDGQVTAEDVTAVITIEGDAALAASETATHVLGDLAGGGSDTTSWTLECTGSGPVTITVTPAGTDANTGMPAPAVADAVTVNQVDKAHLAVTVDAPEDVTVGDEFLITATVANTGQAAAMDVSAALSIAGNAALVSGDLEKDAVPSTLPGSGSVEITWSLRCTGGGAVTLTVTPAGTDENTGVAIPGANLESGSATVDQWYMLFAPIIARGYTP